MYPLLLSMVSGLTQVRATPSSEEAKPQEGSDRLASSSSALLLADNVRPRIQIPAIRLSPVIAVYGSVLPGSEKSRPSLYAPTSSSVEGV